MSQVLIFPARRPLLPRRGAGMRWVAAAILLCFTAAVLVTTIASMASYCLTSDTYSPRRGLSF
ncbi:MAG TPA: hypothetical protein VGR67_15145 [Candidatus Polarisedimenticolia bacterium]|jgi:hypothetical protein|nr:hypothetical protein [Candidatus Polarisedimenticolia bacterium]